MDQRTSPESQRCQARTCKEDRNTPGKVLFFLSVESKCYLHLHVTKCFSWQARLHPSLLCKSGLHFLVIDAVNQQSISICQLRLQTSVLRTWKRHKKTSRLNSGQACLPHHTEPSATPRVVPHDSENIVLNGHVMGHGMLSASMVWPVSTGFGQLWPLIGRTSGSSYGSCRTAGRSSLWGEGQESVRCSIKGTKLLLICIANGDILPRRFWVKLSSVLPRGANLAEQIKLYWSISCDLARVANLPTFLQLKTWTFSGTWLNQHGFMRLHNLQLINPLKLDKLSSCSPAERAQL